MNSILPPRYYAFVLCVLGLLASVAAAGTQLDVAVAPAHT
jgi:hypothetical protein